MPGACQVHFVLNANQMGLNGLSEWANPSPSKRPWYRVLESDAPAGTSFLANVRASGQVTTDRLQVQRLTATRVSAKVSLDRGKLEITELSADFLGGKHQGHWQADFSIKPAVCNGSGSLTGLSLATLADVVKDQGMTGTANASYEVKGSCPAEFWTSADGTLRFDMEDGSLPHIALGEDMGPLRFMRFAGQARLQGGTIEMKDAKLSSPAGKFELSGTSSLKGDLDFKLANTSSGVIAPGYAITGTLAEPRVIQSSSPDTQARLKAEPAKQP
jgi:hypothetical protein